MRQRSPSTLFLALALTFGACGSADEGAEPESGQAPAETDTAGPADEMGLPEATADAVWAYLEASDYTSWALWPGKGEKYEGTEPHGMLLTTYLSPLAAAALEGSELRMPPGAIIVKENFMPDGSYAASTVMYKVEGLDMENNDWWWLKRNADGTVEFSGPGGMCANCHRGMRDNDFIFTGSLGGGGS